jgi:hypothetical protein
MPHLTALELPSFSTKVLRRLCELPHGLRLQRFGVGVGAASTQTHGIQLQRLGLSHTQQAYTLDIGPEEAAELVHLPSLTHLSLQPRSACPSLSFLSFLSRLPLLADLHLDLCATAPSKLNLESVVSALQSCLHLRSLRLHFTALAAEQMEAVVIGMERLERMELRGMQRLRSLSFLTAGSLPNTLTALSLYDCRSFQLRLSELHHLHPLTRLEEVGLFRSFAPGLQDGDVSLSRALFDFQPPSKLIPSLRTFQWENGPQHREA